MKMDLGVPLTMCHRHGMIWGHHMTSSQLNKLLMNHDDIMMILWWYYDDSHAIASIYEVWWNVHWIILLLAPAPRTPSARGWNSSWWHQSPHSPPTPPTPGFYMILRYCRSYSILLDLTIPAGELVSYWKDRRNRMFTTCKWQIWWNTRTSSPLVKLWDPEAPSLKWKYDEICRVQMWNLQNWQNHPVESQTFICLALLEHLGTLPNIDLLKLLLANEVFRRHLNLSAATVSCSASHQNGSKRYPNGILIAEILGRIKFHIGCATWPNLRIRQTDVKT